MTDEPSPVSLSRRAVIWWLVAALCGLVVSCALYNQAIPIASLDLEYSRDEINRQALRTAENALISFSANEAINTTVFDVDRDAKLFLEYKLGVGEANQLMRGTIPVWSWYTRIVKQGVNERIVLHHAPDGTLIKLEQTLDKEKQLPTISHEKARSLALEFASEKAGLLLREWKTIVDKSEKKLNRVDHEFLFEDRSREWEGARLRALVGLSGNRVTRFDHYLHVPELFERTYDKMRSVNNVLQQFSNAALGILSLLCVGILAWAIKERDFRFRFAISVAAATFMIVLLNSVNNLPYKLLEYDTAKSFHSFITSMLTRMLFQSLAYSLIAAILSAAAEFLYRKTFPTRLALEHVFSSRGLCSKQLLIGLFVGICLSMANTGYQTLYYVVGRQLGVFCPMAVFNEQILGVLFSPISAIHLGFIASLFEELLFRVVCLFILLKLTKRFWLANLIQALVWGFGHSNYPQQPAYTRGIELTIGGLISGWVLKRYGLLPCMISHYLFNATVGSMASFLAPSISSKLLAALPLALPVAWLAWSAMSSHRQDPSREALLLNESIEHEDVSEEQVIPRKLDFLKTHPPGRPVVILLAVLSILAPAFIWYQYTYMKAVGHNDRVIFSREEALEFGKRYMKERGLFPDEWSDSAWCSPKLPRRYAELQYLKEHAGFERTRQLVEQTTPSILWHVRFYKSLVKTEYNVYFRADGRLHSFTRTLGEKEYGAKLDENRARTVARKFLATYHPELPGVRLKSVEKKALENRTDYTIKYEIPELQVAEAPYVASIFVAGDKVGRFSGGWDIPDKWLAADRATPDWQIIAIACRSLLFAVLIVFFAICGVQLVRSYGTSIRYSLTIFLVALGFSLIYVAGASDFTGGYSTSVPEEAYETQRVLKWLMATLNYSGILGALAVISTSALRAISRIDIASLTSRMIPLGRKRVTMQRASSFWLEGFLAGTAWSLIAFSVFRLSVISIEHFSPQVLYRGYETLDFVSSPGMIFVTLTHAILQGMTAALLAPMAFYLYKRYILSFPRYLFVVLIYALTLFAASRFWQNCAIDAVETVAYAVIAYLMVRFVIKANPVGYFAFGYSYTLIHDLYWLARDCYPTSALDLSFGVACLLVPLAGSWLWSRRVSQVVDTEVDTDLEPDTASQMSTENSIISESMDKTDDGSSNANENLG